MLKRLLLFLAMVSQDGAADYGAADDRLGEEFKCSNFYLVKPIMTGPMKRALNASSGGYTPMTGLPSIHNSTR